MREWTIRRPIVREALLAALVLALIFLNFGHVNAYAQPGYGVQTSWCGDPVAPDTAAHAPCHACRIGEGAALPPPPITAIAVAFAVARVAYEDIPASVTIPLISTSARPRAPPFA